MYGISYSLLGFLVLLNFCTQLFVDLIFSFFSNKFNIHKTIRIMPVLTALGFVVYATLPCIFPKYAYFGLAVGTFIFSVAAGLSEVLLSPLVASLPSDNPERDMSKLHSLYAYGVVGVVLLSTLFLKLFGTENWMYLTLFFAFLPIIACVLFCISPLPDLNLSQSSSKGGVSKKNKGILLCVACIFLGSAAENTMTNWISGFMENALHLPKATGDILGLAVFALLLAMCRVLYARFTPDIMKTLLISMAGAAVCYLTAGLSSSVLLSFIACILTGLFSSMLWPGTLILMEEKIPGVGVAAFALMAAGGDLGASVAPQLMGIVVDVVSAAPATAGLAQQLSLTPEQIGMKAGMLVSALFPLAGTVVVLLILRAVKSSKRSV
jgi:MFS family permease